MMKTSTEQKNIIKDLIITLKSRLLEMDIVAKQGVIPGQLDTYELEQLIGRVKEVKYLISLCEDYSK